MNIKTVCILGGGSSGWMTASILSKHAPWLKVVLVESEKIGTIGVGESTIGHINTFMRMLGLKDQDWMAECNATYKGSIKFTDFREKGSVFHYPFGDFVNTQNEIMHWFKTAVEKDLAPETFASFFRPAVQMIEQNKLTTTAGVIKSFDPDKHLAYHMDAGLFGEFLRKKFCQNVEHHIDDVVEVTSSNKGIEKLITKSKEFTADLFIDCSGFKSRLLEGALSEPFISFKDSLINDKAIATHIPYIDKESEMELATNCTALSSGWVWNIPLYQHIGTGYVYSSKFATPEEAEAEFRQHLGKRGETAEVKHISIKNGIHKRAWVKNCVAVGLSNGFIEPLESTGLMLTHETILFLIRTLIQQKGRVTSFMRDSFNFAVRDTMEGFRQFIAMHYALSPRNDTPYWNYVTNEIEYDKPLAYFDSPENPRRNTMLDTAYRFMISGEVTDSMGGLPYIIAGMGLNPCSKLEQVIHNYDPSVENLEYYVYEMYQDRVKATNEAIQKLPSHYEYLKQNIYGGVE